MNVLWTVVNEILIQNALKRRFSDFKKWKYTRVIQEVTTGRSFLVRTAHTPTFSPLHLRHSSFSNPSVSVPRSQLILQPFRHSSFSNPSVSLPTSQLILQPFRCLPTSQLILQPFIRFTYVTAHSPTFPSQLILQHFRRFTYVTAHSPTLLLLHLLHSSFSNTSFASPTSQALHLISSGEPPMANKSN